MNLDTQTQTQEIVISVKDVMRRDAIAYLKGFIVGYSVANGMKWSSKKTPSPIFEKGQAKGKSLFYDRYLCNGIHILYNRIRHHRTHTGSVETDTEMLNKAEMISSYSLNPIYSDIGIKKDSKETLYAE